MQPIVKMHGLLSTKPPANHIEPDVMPAVREDGVLGSVCPFDAGEPGRNMLQKQAVGIPRMRRSGNDCQRAGVEGGTPEDPGIGCGETRIFREREAPMRQGPGWRHVWLCSPVCARRHRPDPGAATPT